MENQGWWEGVAWQRNAYVLWLTVLEFPVRHECGLTGGCVAIHRFIHYSFGRSVPFQHAGLPVYLSLLTT